MRFLHELGEVEPVLVVLGGLVPEVLAVDDSAPAHLGTTDVDILLITHINPDADLSAVERALGGIGFEADPTEDGWRWHGLVDGTIVRLEFLCDLPDYPANEIVRPAGCSSLAAANLRGTGFVASDYGWQHLSGHLADGTPVTVRARFAGLGVYLLSKCVAVRTRAATKDNYDLAYVLQFNHSGGPEQAAGQLLNGPLADKLPDLRSTFVEIRERYRKPTDIGPVGYAEQALLVEPEADAALLRADAVDAVQRFVETLGF